jgi:transcriptional regulator with XRE-family HTH domain
MDEVTIGARLRILRRWRGMTQMQLADLAALSPSFVSMVETGQRPLDRRSHIASIATALRVSETDLVDGPHLTPDPLQSDPHLGIPAIRVALQTNTLTTPAVVQPPMPAEWFGLRAVIDLSKPVCILLASVLHFVTPAEADAIVAAFVDAMAPGSYLVLSTGTSTGTSPALIARLADAYQGTSVVSGRSKTEIAAYFTGLDLLPPGLVDVWAWRPHTPQALQTPGGARILGAVARKLVPGVSA